MKKLLSLGIIGLIGFSLTARNLQLESLEDSNEIIYAKWTEALYEITYDYQDDGITPDSVNIIIASNSTSVPADPTRDDYVFSGWYDASVGGNLIT